MMTRVLSVDDTRQPPAPLRPAVEIAERINDAIGSRSMSWWPMDCRLGSTRTIADMRKTWAEVPNDFEVGRGDEAKVVPLRDLAESLVGQYESFDEEFAASHWPARKARLDTALAEMASGFLPKVPVCLGYMFESLGMKDPETSIPAYLVVEAPWPGAFTLSQPSSKGICFVSIDRDELQGTALWEIVLHEATHAFDIDPKGHDLFDEMRDRLEKAGVPRSNRLFRNVPHTVMFVQAAETIRRFVNPAHKHYGDISGYYGRMGEAGEIVRNTWTNHLDGKIDREEAIRIMVDWTAKQVKK